MVRMIAVLWVADEDRREDGCRKRRQLAGPPCSLKPAGEMERRAKYVSFFFSGCTQEEGNNRV
jgi:hypothetical protein